MTTTVDARCSCARDDVEADPQTSRCKRCGKLLREAFVIPAPDKVGAARHSPSAAYRSTIAPFNAARSVAIVENVIPDKPAEPTPEPAPVAPPAVIEPRSPLDWAAEGQGFADRFTAAADALEQQAQILAARAGEHRAEAARLRKSAKTFTLALAELGAIGPPVDAAAGPAWSVRHERCIDCGTIDRPHAAHGRCGHCDNIWRKGPGR